MVSSNVKLAEAEALLTTERTSVLTTREVSSFGSDLYSQRILTPSDWLSFKAYFEREYPGYLNRIRSCFAGITEAEERLFLFVKLRLTNREIATILGISADSVKKTRSRLRKRLNLSENVELENFVLSF